MRKLDPRILKAVMNCTATPSLFPLTEEDKDDQMYGRGAITPLEVYAVAAAIAEVHCLSHHDLCEVGYDDVARAGRNLADLVRNGDVYNGIGSPAEIVRALYAQPGHPACDADPKRVLDQAWEYFLAVRPANPADRITPAAYTWPGALGYLYKGPGNALPEFALTQGEMLHDDHVCIHAAVHIDGERLTLTQRTYTVTDAENLCAYPGVKVTERRLGTYTPQGVTDLDAEPGHVAEALASLHPADRYLAARWVAEYGGDAPQLDRPEDALHLMALYRHSGLALKSAVGEYHLPF